MAVTENNVTNAISLWNRALEQYAVLQQLGAGHIQGFLLGRPQPADAISEQLEALQPPR